VAVVVIVVVIETPNRQRSRTSGKMLHRKNVTHLHK
jgi:hypothetical protein